MIPIITWNVVVLVSLLVLYKKVKKPYPDKVILFGSLGHKMSGGKGSAIDL